MFLSEQFWLRWRQHHLDNLQKRNKWKRTNHHINIGDVVMVKGPSKRNTWPMGRVLKVNKGRDGLTRSVILRVPGGNADSQRTLERSIRDTVLLISSVQS